MDIITNGIFKEFFQFSINYSSFFAAHPQKAFFDVEENYGYFIFDNDEDWELFGVKKYIFPEEKQGVIEVTELLKSISVGENKIRIKAKIHEFLEKKKGVMFLKIERLKTN